MQHAGKCSGPQQPVFFDVSDPQELGTPEILPSPLTRRSTNMAEGADVGGLAMAAREVSSGFHVLMCCQEAKESISMEDDNCGDASQDVKARAAWWL
jgi:hypothetical protein